MLDELLLHVQAEVVEGTDIAAIGATILGIGVAALERGQKTVVTLTGLLVRANHNAGRVVDTRDADLKRLTIVLDRNGLATSLVRTNIADADAGDVQVLRRDDCSGSHIELCELSWPRCHRILFPHTFPVFKNVYKLSNATVCGTAEQEVDRPVWVDCVAWTYGVWSPRTM